MSSADVFELLTSDNIRINCKPVPRSEYEQLAGNKVRLSKTVFDHDDKIVAAVMSTNASFLGNGITRQRCKIALPVQDFGRLERFKHRFEAEDVYVHVFCKISSHEWYKWGKGKVTEVRLKGQGADFSFYIVERAEMLRQPTVGEDVQYYATGLAQRTVGDDRGLKEGEMRLIEQKQMLEQQKQAIDREWEKLEKRSDKLQAAEQAFAQKRSDPQKVYTRPTQNVAQKRSDPQQVYTRPTRNVAQKRSDPQQAYTRPTRNVAQKRSDAEPNKRTKFARHRHCARDEDEEYEDSDSSSSSDSEQSDVSGDAEDVPLCITNVATRVDDVTTRVDELEKLVQHLARKQLQYVKK
jgi:hypothetical protein